MVNADTLAALQIFQSEAHAQIHSSERKDGLSLYGPSPPPFPLL